MTDSIVFEGTEYLIPEIGKDSIFNYVERIKDISGKRLGYRVTKNIGYFSPRYEKWLFLKIGDILDGATGARDNDSFSWVWHDAASAFGCFSDGVKMSNWQASMIISDILSLEGRWFRSATWFIGTWLIGGGKARKNGML